MRCSERRRSYIILITLLLSGDFEQWNQMRSLLAKDAKEKDIDAYFENIFAAKIKKRILQESTYLFRARQIKTQDWAEIGATKERILDQLYSILLTPKDLKAINSVKGLTVSKETLFQCKLAQTKHFTKEQLKQFDNINKKYSLPSFYGFPAKESGCPPEEFRKDQRLSTKEDEYLYLAMDMETAIYEMRPAKKQTYSVAKGKLKKEIQLADLQDASKYIESDEFRIGNIIEKISEPNTDNDATFYKITQRLSNFIKTQGFDGIVYQSSLKENGVNVVLFDSKLVEFIETSVITVNSVDINFTTNFPFNTDG